MDIPAAFDTVDHSILCQRAESDFRVSGMALKWLHPYGDCQRRTTSGKSSEIVPSLCMPCVCSATTAWPMSASTPCSGQSSSQSCCTPVQHGADSSERLTDIASTRSSAAANAVAVIQTFSLSTNFLRRVTIGCFTNSVVTLDIHYTLPSPTTQNGITTLQSPRYINT